MEVVLAEDALTELARRAEEADVVVRGIQRRARRRKVFGALPVALARRTTTPLLLLSRRG